MCGIAGAIAPSSSNVTRESIARMLDALAHRGPDGHGIVEYGTASGQRVLLGHRRLAIIDPEGGKQPMCDDEAGLAITFNGEIYNFRELRDELEACGYRFALHSDTEVLLRAYQQWGDRVVERLRGMFAFAIWDARTQRLFLARVHQPIAAAGRVEIAAPAPERRVVFLPERFPAIWLRPGL